MGKHKGDRFSQTLANGHNYAGFAPQVPHIKTQQSNHSRRGK
jgi:hypothetical protein